MGLLIPNGGVRFLAGALPFECNPCYNRVMNTYKYKVILQVEVEAFDESDAWDAVQDAFGIGDQAGVVVTDCNYEQSRGRKKK